MKTYYLHDRTIVTKVNGSYYNMCGALSLSGGIQTIPLIKLNNINQIILNDIHKISKSIESATGANLPLLQNESIESINILASAPKLISITILIDTIIISRLSPTETYENRIKLINYSYETLKKACKRKL